MCMLNKYKFPGFFVSFLFHKRNEKPAWLEGIKNEKHFPVYV